MIITIHQKSISLDVLFGLLMYGPEGGESAVPRTKTTKQPHTKTVEKQDEISFSKDRISPHITKSRRKYISLLPA